MSLPRLLGLGDATMLVVSSVIGVGIFFTPGRVAELLPSAPWFFAAWLLGGLLSLSGALANAELGAMFPRAGGNYVYLSQAYHPAAGFLAGWLSFFVIFAGTIATLGVGVALSIGELTPLSAGERTAIAIGVIWLATAVNARATRWGARLNNVTATLKLLAIGALAIVGLLAALGAWRVHGAPPVVGVAPGPVHATRVTVASFGLAMSPVLFSYLGWNASVYVAGELRDPGVTLPRSLFLGLGICCAAYLLVCAAFVGTLGVPAMAGHPAVGAAAGEALFGGAGRPFMAAILLASVFGCLSANVLVGPRVLYAMAEDGLFARAAARLGPSGTPSAAVAVQAIVASALVLAFEDLDRVLDYTTFAIVLSTLADASALYVLRRREPERARPYRAAGYPWMPALYVAAHLGVAASMLLARPVECAVGAAVLASGLPVYVAFAARRRHRGHAQRAGGGGAGAP